jgi:CheY-like chemotaxis protein
MTLVVVIDDDPFIRTVVRTWLERRGMEVLVADSGPAGIEHLETFAVDLAVVDIFMPDMDGLQIIRRLSRAIPRVPVIAMSDFLPPGHHPNAPDFLSMAGRLGAAFCLRKPCPADRLIAAMAACLGAPQEEREDPIHEDLIQVPSRHALIEISSSERRGGKPISRVASQEEQPASERL